jgi:hypothetical protein
MIVAFDLQRRSLPGQEAEEAHAGDLDRRDHQSEDQRDGGEHRDAVVAADGRADELQPQQKREDDRGGEQSEQEDQLRLRAERQLSETDDGSSPFAPVDTGCGAKAE